MSKRTATKSSKAPKPKVVKRSRSVGIGEAKPEDVAKYVEGYRVWRRSFENPAEHQAYIESICRRIVEQFSPEKIILFGSHASGRPGPDSDLDLLVVMHFEGGYFHQASEIRRHLGLPIPLDLLVRTPKQVQKRLEIGDRFMREIIERGEVIYEADHRSDGSKKRKRIGLLCCDHIAREKTLRIMPPAFTRNSGWRNISREGWKNSVPPSGKRTI